MTRGTPWGRVRETICFFWGHDWKSSWRHRADRAARMALDRREQEWKDGIPYADRQAGNPFCEYSQGWHFKCRRCRTRTRDWLWVPWWRDLWGAVQTYAQCFRIGVTCYWPYPKRRIGYPYTEYPWSAWLLSLVTTFSFAWEQAYAGWAHARRWPMWPAFVSSEDCYQIHRKWIEGKGVTYDWFPPMDPDDPTELGMWLRRGQYEKGSLHRPRMWYRTGEAEAESWTAGPKGWGV